ncbi:MAG: TerB family tellurite resistance protein [Parvibaculaceae bacterium]
MLKRLQALLTTNDTPEPVQAFDDVRMAAAALLITAAVMDEEYGKTEQAQIRTILQNFFELTDEETRELVALAEDEEQRAVDLYGWTRTLKDAYEVEERARLIEMLWEVAYADGHLHPFEASLLRRVAGLIYVPDVQVGAARKRVMARLGVEE